MVVNERDVTDLNRLQEQLLREERVREKAQNQAPQNSSRNRTNSSQNCGSKGLDTRNKTNGKIDLTDMRGNQQSADSSQG